jgi:TolB-like protein/Tfp pilus assembly protein PilF
MSIVQELKRRNVIKVAVAYAVVAWLLIEVTSTVFPILKLPDWSVTLVTAFVLIGFPLALIFAWAFEITPEGIKREKDVDRSQSITHITGRNIDYLIIAALVLALGFFAFDKFVLDPSRDAELVQATTEAVFEQVAESGNAQNTEKSIAVLPFVNMSDDPGNEYFSDGISEELLNVLIKVEGLRVVSRTSSFAFKGKDISIPEIAKKLHVDHILEGSVRKAGNTVRVTAQLIDVRTDSHLWSATYDRELEDIFAIQDEISGQIVQALKIALGAGEKEAMVHAQKPTEDLAAYELYLRGRYAWQRRAEGDSLRRAIGLFQQATKLDPQFARAWSSLAAAHTTLPDYSDASAAEQYPMAVSAAHKALMLDDSLAEAYAVLGDMARVDRKWEEAEAYYLRAIASEPKNSTAHVWYGEFFVMVGRLHDALEQFRIAYQLDPLHPVTNKSMAIIYFYLDDTSNALKYGTAAWDLNHSLGLYVQAMTHFRLGEFDRAIELAEQYDERLAGMTKSRMIIVRLFVEAKTNPAKRPVFLDKLAQNESVLRFRSLVLSYVVFGRIDDAYRLVNMNRNPARFTFLWIIWQPELAAFRQDPRFAELVTELGLVDYWREHGWPDACQPAGESLICE